MNYLIRAVACYDVIFQSYERLKNNELINKLVMKVVDRNFLC